jgi:hypothetical protein
MNNKGKRKPNNWTKEETDNIVNAFKWLIEQDKKQNPDLYKNRRSESVEKLEE